MARLPWKARFDAATSSTDPRPRALAFVLRNIRDDGEDAIFDLLGRLADMLDPPPDHSGVTLRMIKPRGGSTADAELQLEIFSELRDGILKGHKPIAIIYGAARKFGVSERTVSRLFETAKDDVEESRAAADSQCPD
jgi:hypothetical protein